MGKNKARHILHGVLDCLPIILIPIFMIYSQNHEINDNSINVVENKEVYFNQIAKFQQRGSTAYILNDSEITLNTTGNVYPRFDMQYWVNNHKYIIYPYSTDTVATLSLNISKTNSQTSILTNITLNQYSAFTYDNTNVDYVYLGFGSTNGIKIYINLFDLTYIFGEGYEPSIIEFTRYYNENTYPFSVNEIQYIPLYEQTYNDTDIMSQSFYCLYNSVDKYFNMGNVFGMQNLYTWFETNIFGGTASPSIYIVWNIVLYEFVMDLLFLLYGLFMFFIDLCKRLMEKPLNSIK